MSPNNPNSNDQEISLSDIRNRVNSVFEGFNRTIFLSIRFVLKNIVIIAVLFAIGVGLGIWMDGKTRSYDHTAVVTPNFGSVDYLYSKVDLIQNKIEEGDTLFLKQIGIAEPKKLRKVEIKPITDVYGFVRGNDRNFDMIKLMAENGDITKIIEDPVTGKNYFYHQLHFVTKGETDRKEVVDPLFDYLNDSDFFRRIQAEAIKNYDIQVAANDRTIEQINLFLDKLAVSANGASGQVNINENSQLNDVLQTKNDLIQTQGELRVERVGMDKIIKEKALNLNSENTKSVNGKMKLVLPLLFIGLFVAVKLFLAFYRKQSIRYQQENL